MVSDRKTRIHLPQTATFDERRILDTEELRLAEITVPINPGLISPLRDRLLSSFDEFSVSLDLGPTQICMAIEECLANAFYHGSLELDSALKEDGTDRFSQLARERCSQAKYQERQIHVTELATPYGIWLTIRDEGKGFDVRAALKRAEDPMSLLASGRGLVMMKAFTDELLFNAVGNEVTLVVYSNRNRDVVELLQERAQTHRVDTGRRSLT